MREWTVPDYQCIFKFVAYGVPSYFFPVTKRHVYSAKSDFKYSLSFGPLLL